MKSSLTYKLLGAYVLVLAFLLLSKYYLQQLDVGEALGTLFSELINKAIGF